MASIQGLLVCGFVVALMSVSTAQEVEDICSFIDCLPGQKCVYDFTDGAKCVCRRDTDCPASSSPLCGSDGKSYKNHCIMKATACREDRHINQVKAGSCLPNNACQIKPTSPCMAFLSRFYFNVTTKKCEMFTAGGCHPSGWNGFHTKKDCNDRCIDNACQIKPTSPCRAYFERFYFNVTTQKCEKFIAGGCHPSGWNGFHTKKECNDRCIDDACQIKPTSSCMAFFPRFYFNVTTQKCKEFIAGGCHPSGWNGFHTKKECSDRCIGQGLGSDRALA